MSEIQMIEDVLYMYTTPFENRWSNHIFFETEKMIEEMKAEFPDWVEGDLQVSCGKMLAPPYSYGKNMYSVAKI